MLESRRHRLFFALWPDAETASHLHALATDLVQHSRGRGRVMRADTLHMTLAFVGNVTTPQLDTLVDAASEVVADGFEVSLDRLGFWPRGGVVYAGCSRAPSRQRLLFEQVARILDTTGFAPPGRGLGKPEPHVTLARAVRGADLPRLGAALRWRAQEFALVESHLHPSGARYQTLASWPLHDDTRED
jgi:2'-5' RNA ligase